VFDKRGDNLYADNGDLDRDRSDKTEHVVLHRPECVVRNCVFLNGARSALVLANGQTLENCIVMNHTTFAVEVRSGFSPRPILIRNNTLAFSWDIKFGQGHGAPGSLLRLGGRVQARVEGNIFEFADNDAIKCDAAPADVELLDNVFAHDLWSHVAHADKVVDDQAFAQLEQLGFKACSGNRVLIPGLPMEQKWFDVYLGRTAYVPGKVQMDDWNKLRELLGQPLIATGGKMPEGFAPAYPLEAALRLFPGNAECQAGARRRALTAQFAGVVREEPVREYGASSWDVARDRTAWDALDGKRVALTLAFYGEDNQFPLPEAPEAEYRAFRVGDPAGPEGPGGLPLRAYVRRGTRHERAMKQGSGDPRERPHTTWVVRGIARAGRQLIVEAVERAE
jgi:hypothetical protein